MEFAGQALGSFTILDIAEKAAAIGKVINEVKSFPDDVAEILFQLANEAQKLEAWATETTLYTKTQGPLKSEANDVQAAISKALSTAVERVLLALADARSVTDKIGITTALEIPLPHNPPATDISNLSLEDNRDSALHGAKAREELIEKTLKSKGWRKKAAFSFKPWGVSDKEKLQESVDKLKYWNGELWALLSRRQRLTLDFQVSCQILAVAADEHATLQTVQRASAASSDLVASAGLAEANITIEQDKSSSLEPIAWKRLEWFDSDFHQRSQLAALKGSDPAAKNTVIALVNWLDYSSFTVDQQTIALERVGKLTKLLSVTSKPSGLCTLNAYGFAKDAVRKRFGLVFELPSQIKAQSISDVNVISLSNLLAGKPAPRPGQDGKKIPSYARPTLPQRFQLARNLAIALMELHNARWLHKGFNSDCVVFFESGSTVATDSIIYAEPFITGFEFSRPVGPKNISLPISMAAGAELYQHPWLLSSSASAKTDAPGDAAAAKALVQMGDRLRFRPAFDLYSLGVVLLEIALWQPVKNLRRPDASAHSFAEQLRKVAQANVPHTMGDKYAKVVMTCLKTDFRMPDQYESNEEDEQESIARELGRIYWEVARPLEECHCKQ